MKKLCKRHKRGKPALFRPGWYCARCPAFIEDKRATATKRVSDSRATKEKQ